MGRSSDIEYQSGTESHEVAWKESNSTDDDNSSSSSPQHDARAQQKPTTTSPCKRRMITAVVFVVLLIVAAVGLSVAFLGRVNPIEFFVQEDPPGRNETHEWRTFGRFDGLELIIENALEDAWTPYLTDYVEKWDAGVDGVDPLTLSVERVEVDFFCDATPGRLKVCNGDYGRTDWRGINIILLHYDFIAHSVAKLNDYWLQKEGDIQMKYTMCHELGHGFGLPHTDENYWNINTGECMDYTERPRSNLDPGLFNFELLAEIYGTTPIIADADNTGDRLRRRTSSVVDGAGIPASVTQKYYKVVEQIESMLCVDCLVELGDGYRVEVHQLRVEGA